MKLLKRVRKTSGLGADSHEGWLPPEAVTPIPTSQVDLQLEIALDDTGGYFLFSRGSVDSSLRDTWHPSLEEALDQALEQFGIQPSEWADVE